ncbi:hypothetical protein BKK79_37020 (plasmid) [Cupriavidus sp. USMAA2-4]|uniref:type II secretion system protein GspL n=1 Tax=Cupriavidus sp. USMAA2-4 TaxID=876364 RepID=UPI0008A6EA84|nr:type II secretion system protein GspL [Cupriavidus sp. USMAA2-4]AOY97544.1 hypothetical protein BKK79_37020 [Cupriavidus sp. USMAA2-4]
MPEPAARCYVRLPARPAPARGQGSAPLQALSYALADAHGEWLGSGLADAGALPPSRETILIADARDVLLLRLPLPAVGGARLRETLPGLVEDHLLGDPEQSHIAVLARHPDGQATLAVIARDWLAQVLDAVGGRRLRVLPAALCVPQRDGRAAVVVEALPGGAGAAPALCLTVRTAAGLGHGMALAPAQATHWLGTRLADADLYVDAAAAAALAHDASAGAAAWPLWIAGASALADTDLCQFEFARARRQAAAQGARARWRWPLRLGAAALLLCVAGIHLQAWLLARQQAALRAGMEAEVRRHFPAAGPIVDAPRQMRQQLDTLARARGAPLPGDLADLADRLAQALGPVPPEAVTELRYRERTLEARLADTAQVDAEALRRRLEAAGLSARFADGRWQMRLAS